MQGHRNAKHPGQVVHALADLPRQAPPQGRDEHRQDDEGGHGERDEAGDARDPRPQEGEVALEAPADDVRDGVQQQAVPGQVRTQGDVEVVEVVEGDVVGDERSGEERAEVVALGREHQHEGGVHPVGGHPADGEEDHRVPFLGAHGVPGADGSVVLDQRDGAEPDAPEDAEQLRQAHRPPEAALHPRDDALFRFLAQELPLWAHHLRGEHRSRVCTAEYAGDGRGAGQRCIGRGGGAPPCDIPSGCFSSTGPWTVTRSPLRMLRRVAAFCRPLRPVLPLVSFRRSRSPVVGVPGLC